MNNCLTRRKFLTAAASVSIAVANSKSLLGAPDKSKEVPAMPEKIRVGIIGLEGHYSEITSAAKILPNIHIGAISDPTAAVLEKAIRSPAFASATSWIDYRPMLAQEKLDVVAVCGENGIRAAIVKACAERGLPIVAEKPLALTLSELAEVKHSIARNRVPLSLLLTMRFEAQYQAMRNIVRAGEIGEVVSMDAQKSYQLGTRPQWMKSRKSYGGTIPYIGIHMIDLMRWISGREMVEAAAFHSTVGAPDLREMENNTAMIFKLDNRGTASLRMDYLRPPTASTHGDDRIRIVGTKGIVEYQEEQGLTLITSSHPKTSIKDLPKVKPLFIDFLESIYLKTPHLITIEDIFRISEIVLKTRAAADSDCLVRL
ncbi:MAG: oxidoreductase domain protein [Verrucomicrobiales bacterium]|nr:oxidoreductase domain protein [Verrucomicrobiales bacterium]